MPKATPYARRLHDARERAGLSQKALGIAAGIDPFVASTRINRYERGIHEPDLQTARQIARAAKLPLAFFYADDDELADLIALYSITSKSAREKIIRAFRNSTAPSS